LISQILDENGCQCTTSGDIASAFTQNYLHLFTPTILANIGYCIHAIQSKVSANMNAQLLTEFTVEEVSSALK
jgi:hypothetical protein